MDICPVVKESQSGKGTSLRSFKYRQRSSADTPCMSIAFVSEDTPCWEGLIALEILSFTEGSLMVVPSH